MSEKKYKDINLYSCLVLNLLASALDLDISQEDLSSKFDRALKKGVSGLTKMEVMHFLRTNHNMTEKILNHLLEMDYISINKNEKVYQILPTLKGLKHVKEFNRFYASLYSKQIEDHYRYIGLPAWYRTYKE